MRPFYTHPAWADEAIAEDIAEYTQLRIRDCARDPSSWPSDFALARKIDAWLKGRGIAETLPALIVSCHPALPDGSTMFTLHGMIVAKRVADEICDGFRRVQQ